jgi:hypothetical protein
VLVELVPVLVPALVPVLVQGQRCRKKEQREYQPNNLHQKGAKEKTAHKKGATEKQVESAGYHHITENLPGWQENVR